jgi:hypothetical protein
VSFVYYGYCAFTGFGVVADDGCPELGLQVDIVGFNISERMSRAEQKAIPFTVAGVEVRWIVFNDSEIEFFSCFITPGPFPARWLSN